jgi:DNA-binding HxlR family transcriptional regulator
VNADSSETFAVSRRAPDPAVWTATTQEVLALLGRKWLVSIVRELLDGPRRHFQLRCAIKGIQPKVLRETLRFLERDGMVERVLHDDGVGGKAIAYELTGLGRTLVEPLVAVCEWGRKHLDEVHARQSASARLRDVG